MTTDRKPEYLVSLVHELCKLPQETEWVELDGYLTVTVLGDSSTVG